MKFIPVTLRLLGATATFLIPAANHIAFIIGFLFCVFINPMVSALIRSFFHKKEKVSGELVTQAAI